MKRLKLAIIGCRGLVYDFIYDCTKALPVDLVALCGNPEDTAMFASRYSVTEIYSEYTEMLKKQHPDIVISFVENEKQNTVAAECLKAGAYVFSERPVCMSSEDAIALVKLQHETGRYIMPRFNRRHVPAYLMARDILSRKEFGKPNMFLAKFHAPEYASEKALLWNHISHIVDLARFLLGEITVLHSEKVRITPTKVCYNISFVTPDKCIGTIQSGSTQCYEYPMERVEISGDSRNVIVDNIRSLQYNRPAPERKSNSAMTLSETGDTLIWNQNFGQLTNFTYYGFEGCLESLVCAALTNTRPSFDISDTVNTIKIIEQIEQIAIEV